MPTEEKLIAFPSEHDRIYECKLYVDSTKMEKPKLSLSLDELVELGRPLKIP